MLKEPIYIKYCHLDIETDDPEDTDDDESYLPLLLETEPEWEQDDAE
jgi:hypothetical protein